MSILSYVVELYFTDDNAVTYPEFKRFVGIFDISKKCEENFSAEVASKIIEMLKDKPVDMINNIISGIDNIGTALYVIEHFSDTVNEENKLSCYQSDTKQNFQRFPKFSQFIVKHKLQKHEDYQKKLREEEIEIQRKNAEYVKKVEESKTDNSEIVKLQEMIKKLEETNLAQQKAIDEHIKKLSIMKELVGQSAV
jgi:hypothetical protein